MRVLEHFVREGGGHAAAEARGVLRDGGLGTQVVEAVYEDEAVLLVDVAGLVAGALIDELEGKKELLEVLCAGGGGDGRVVLDDVLEDLNMDLAGEVVP